MVERDINKHLFNQECPKCHTEHWVVIGRWVDTCDVCGHAFDIERDDDAERKDREEFKNNRGDYMIFGFLIAFLLLTGCGGSGGAAKPSPNEQNDRQALEYTAEELINWKEACIDENTPKAEHARDACLAADAFSDEICVMNYEANLVRLDSAWDESKRQAFVELQGCLNYFGMTDEFCYAKYEEHLSFYVDLNCESAAVWN